MDEVAVSNEGGEHTSVWIGADRNTALRLLPFEGVLWACVFICIFLLNTVSSGSIPEYAVATICATAFLIRFVAHILAVTKTRYSFDSTGIRISGPFKSKEIPWKNVRDISLRHWRNGGNRKITIRASKDLFGPRELTGYWDLKRIEAAIRTTMPLAMIVHNKRSWTGPPGIKTRALLAAIATLALGYFLHQ